jgi:hypothetical protein
MSNSNTHTDKQLLIASKYFIYHIKMYVETLLWLQSHEQPNEWDTVRNAILESHLIHERVLINFICNSTTKQYTDVLAIHYFRDSPNDFYPLKDELLNSEAKSIGGQLVHLTIKSTSLKSEQEWQIREVANKLVPTISGFLDNVVETRFTKDVKVECLQHLAKISPSQIPVSIKAST